MDFFLDLILASMSDKHQLMMLRIIFIIAVLFTIGIIYWYFMIVQPG